MSEMFCNPDTCPNCQYIGEGDSYCDAIGEIVLEDWLPTEHFMGAGCPYPQRKSGGSRRGRRRTRAMKKGGKRNGQKG